jgi:hypothetical protein
MAYINHQFTLTPLISIDTIILSLHEFNPANLPYYRHQSTTVSLSWQHIMHSCIIGYLIGAV